MSSFHEQLQQQLADIAGQGLYRELRRVDSAQGKYIQFEGRQFLNFSSNDYLGLANEPSLKEAAIKATQQFGAGSGASRLICGSLAPHHQLEETLANFKGCEAALSFSSGYAAALGTICALLGKDDIIVLDKLVHASIVDAARLSGAKIRVFAHNDLNDLESILKWANEKRALEQRRVLIVTESIFSMDGDAAPLKEIVKLKEKHGAWLMVDEAHATGMFGKRRRGLAEELQVTEQIEVQMGTLGKAIGAGGGYVCGSKLLIELLINRARSFVFSTAPPPGTAAAATAGIELIQSEVGQEKRNTLFERLKQFREGFGNSLVASSAIVPVIIGDEAEAVGAAATLREQNIFIPAIRYPTVARGQARLRITFSACHSQEDVATLLCSMGSLLSNGSEFRNA